MSVEIGKKLARCVDREVTAPRSQEIQSLRTGWKCVGLGAVFHLQAVLDHTKEVISGRQRRAFGVREEALFRESRKNYQRLRRPDPRLPPPVLERKRLCDKLDLT